MSQKFLECLFVSGLTLLLRWSDPLTGGFRTAVVSRAVDLCCICEDPSLEPPQLAIAADVSDCISL